MCTAQKLQYTSVTSCIWFLDYLLRASSSSTFSMPSQLLVCRPVPGSPGNTKLLLPLPKLILHDHSFALALQISLEQAPIQRSWKLMWWCPKQHLAVQYHTGCTRYADPKGPCYCLFPARGNGTLQSSVTTNIIVNINVNWLRLKP